MNTEELEFPLPEHLIAQTPAEARDQSRLLVYHRATGEVVHTVFRELPAFLPFPCRVFRNNATVFKARLRGRRVGGGAVECLLLEPGQEFGTFRCLLRPGKRLVPGKSFEVAGVFSAEVLSKTGEGRFEVIFRRDGVPCDPLEVAEVAGEMPLPPYIRREGGGDPRFREVDESRYQTVYADPARRVAAAAPTAGLHFTPELIAEMRERGASFHDLTLHVGLGTFQPVSVARLEEHRIHEEFYEVPGATQAALRAGGPRVMVGTTSVRAAEDWFRRTGDGQAEVVKDFWARAAIFIRPPDHFGVTDHLITNFHLPRSTLLCLVGAFLEPGGDGGLEQLKALYAEAVAREYRFFSYGDAMLIL